MFVICPSLPLPEGGNSTIRQGVNFPLRLTPALAAGVIGGLAVGALAAQAAPRYHAYPAYGYGYGPGYAPVYRTCYNQRRAAYDPWGNFAGYRVVRVCR